MIAFALTAPARAQYNDVAGRSAPRVRAPMAVTHADGTVTVEQREQAPARDRYGNADGNRFDLAVDGAFEGQTVAVLHLYTGEGFDFSLPRAALRQKGFSVYRWANQAPSPEVLREGLARASQLWVISDSTSKLTPAHLDAIQEFFERGRGVYIWGDNAPYYADANAVAERLLGARMEGNVQGDVVVPLQRGGAGAGIVRDHLLSTGLEQLYEGITIATVAPAPAMRPLLYGSAGNLVAAYYDQGGRRAILDGGFTRLFLRWDTAGTARYVKNAAAWLANAERFGAAVVAPGLRAAPTVNAPPAQAPPASAPRTAPAARAATHSDARGWGRAIGLVAIALGAAVAFAGRSRRVGG